MFPTLNFTEQFLTAAKLILMIILFYSSLKIPLLSHSLKAVLPFICHCIYVFRVFLRIVSNYFPKQHQKIGLCDGDEFCLL